MIIAIDGPAGAGKSTISKEIAKRLGFTYLDTGAMYRACGLYVVSMGEDPSDEKKVRYLLANIKIEFQDSRIFLNGEDVSLKIRTPEIDEAASKISRLKSVREKLTELQRQIAKDKDIVAEGRDMGTVVFPDAEVKIFLDASPEERARRRKRQLEESGQIISFEIILHQIKKRDKADSTRALAPLTAAPDAVIIDTTEMKPESVIERIIDEVDKKRNSKR